jgi:hypothetical protein
MKPLTLTLAVALATTAHATVFTVSNDPATPAQYTDVQAAHDAASPGDTLLVKASTSSYGWLYLDRPLTVIGEGYNTDGPYTSISGVQTWPGSDGSNFIGFRAYFYLAGNGPISNVLIERCGGSVYGGNYSYGVTGLIVKHCVIDGDVALYNCTQVLITNNLIIGQIYGSTAPSVSIQNNVFMSNGGNVLLSIQNAVVSNNIFYGSSPSQDGYGVTNCAFNNNISFGTSDDDLPPTGTGNVGSGNQQGVDPLFVNVPDFYWAPSYDLHLQAGSPGIGAGTDGTDIGLYGGGFPLNVPLDGLPRLPQVTQFNLLNTSIGEGGSLNVQVQGAKHD